MENEIMALRKVISMLINQMMIMKNENEMLKTQLMINRLKDANSKIAGKAVTEDYAMGENENAILPVDYAIGKNTDVIIHEDNAKGEKIDMVISDKDAIGKNADTIIPKEDAIGKKNDAIIPEDYAIGENSHTINPVFLSNSVFSFNTEDSGSDVLKTEDLLKPLFSAQPEVLQSIRSVLFPQSQTPERKPVQKVAPAKIDINPQNVNKMVNHLKGYFNRYANYDMRKNVVRQLLFMHNTGIVTGNQLRMMSGLSKDGFAKHLPKLHRGPLVHKIAYNKYSLTEISQKAIIEIFGEEIKPAD